MACLLETNNKFWTTKSKQANKLAHLGNDEGRGFVGAGGRLVASRRRVCRQQHAARRRGRAAYDCFVVVVFMVGVEKQGVCVEEELRSNGKAQKALMPCKTKKCSPRILASPPLYALDHAMYRSKRIDTHLKQRRLAQSRRGGALGVPFFGRGVLFLFAERGSSFGLQELRSGELLLNVL